MAPIAKYRFDIEEAVENAPSKKSRFSKFLGYLVRFIELLVAFILFGLVVYEFTLRKSHHEANLNRTSTTNVTIVPMLTTENVWSAQTIGLTENEASTVSSTTDPRTTTFDWTSTVQTESQSDTTTGLDLGTLTSTEDYSFTTIVITSSVTTTEAATEATTESSAPTDVATQKVGSFYYNLQERSLRYLVFFEKANWTECVPKWMDIPEYLDRQWMALQCVQEYKKGTFVVYNTPYSGYTLDEVEKKLMMHCMMGEVFVPCAKVLNGNKITGSPLASRNCTYCRNKPRD